MLRDLGRRLALRALGTRRPANVAMLHIGRCGSTVVARTLATHPRVHWADELFAGYVHRLRQAGLDPFGDWDRSVLNDRLQPRDRLRSSMLKAGARVYGVEIKFYHIRAMGESIESALELLEGLDFDRFILLSRRNVLRKIISNQRAREAGYYHSSAGSEGKTPDEGRPVTLDPDDVLVDTRRSTLVEAIGRIEADVAEAARALQQRTSLTLVYEDHVEGDPRVAARLALEFMGLSPRKLPEPSLRRLNARPVAELVSNYDELRAHLAGSRFAWMLEEETSAPAG